MRQKSPRCAAVLLLTLSAGCFSYSPVSVAELTPGETVRAYLTREQARELNSLMGFDRRDLIGTVVNRTDDGLLLEVRAVTADAVPGGRALKQRVAVPMSGVLDIEERRLNGWRTAAFAVTVTVALGFLIGMQLDDGENSDVREPKPNPEAMRVPWLRIGIPNPGGGP